MFLVIGILILALFIYLGYDLMSAINRANTVSNSKVSIIGYKTSGADGLVEVITSEGRSVTLVDKNREHQAEIACRNTQDPVWIRFHISVEWILFLTLELYIDGLYN